MDKMKIKIEIEEGGMRSTHEFEGAILRKKIIDFLDAAGVFLEASDDLQEDPIAKSMNKQPYFAGQAGDFRGGGVPRLVVLIERY